MLSDFDYNRIVQALGHAERNASQSEKSNWRSVLRNFETECSTTAIPMPIAVAPTEELLDDDFKPLTLDELIIKVRKSMDSTREQRKGFVAEGDKSMKDYADGWMHALTFVLANADQKWWDETEKLNR